MQRSGSTDQWRLLSDPDPSEEVNPALKSLPVPPSHSIFLSDLKFEEMVLMSGTVAVYKVWLDIYPFNK